MWKTSNCQQKLPGSTLSQLVQPWCVASLLITLSFPLVTNAKWGATPAQPACQALLASPSTQGCHWLSMTTQLLSHCMKKTGVLFQKLHPKGPLQLPTSAAFPAAYRFFLIEIHLILTQDYRFWPDLTCRAHTIARNNLRQGFLKGVVLLGVFFSRKSCWGSNIAANEEGLLDSFQGLILWCFLRPTQLLWHCETTNTSQVFLEFLSYGFKLPFWKHKVSENMQFNGAWVIAVA